MITNYLKVKKSVMMILTNKLKKSLFSIKVSKVWKKKILLKNNMIMLMIQYGIRKYKKKKMIKINQNKKSKIFLMNMIYFIRKNLCLLKKIKMVNINKSKKNIMLQTSS